MLLCYMTRVFIFDFFFFQAEDGIRDLTVTGVQTCALPIWLRDRRAVHHGSARQTGDPPPGAAREGSAYCRGRRQPRQLPAPLLDRKSTRLNSSHSQISYAVFCLKKKKIKKQILIIPKT